MTGSFSAAARNVWLRQDATGESIVFLSYERRVVVFCLLAAGVHSVEVLFDETPVPKSPFQVEVGEGCDPSRVQAKGPGLEEALTDKPNKFSIVTRLKSFTNHALHVTFHFTVRITCAILL